MNGVRCTRHPGTGNCRECERERQRRWREENRERARQVSRESAARVRRAAGVNQHGSPAHRERLRELKTRPVVGYVAIHTRLRTQRGPASGYACVSCGDTARNWSLSWRRMSIERLLFSAGSDRRSPFSLDLSDYDPRCTSCAALYDVGGVKVEGETDE